MYVLKANMFNPSTFLLEKEVYRKVLLAGPQWLTHVILPVQEMEIRRIEV
jgi:hypothetical protein